MRFSFAYLSYIIMLCGDRITISKLEKRFGSSFNIFGVFIFNILRLEKKERRFNVLKYLWFYGPKRISYKKFFYKKIDRVVFKYVLRRVKSVLSRNASSLVAKHDRTVVPHEKYTDTFPFVKYLKRLIQKT
jgi:hypothetical protein